ncbi:chemotaxis protein CheX [Oscillospiraceae bacterium LTW-04]|nr:chemotaxis protein CheX [Oscillospiraceae bacterium MB24-C1]
MPTKFYVPFLQATCNVFELMLDLSDISDRPVESFKCEDELDISIEIVGDLVGEVVYRFPHETSLNIVNIMSGMEMELVDDFVISAISEISNIISGNVMTMLAGEDLTCDIRPPRLKKADESKQYALRNNCCISTSAGDVCLEIRLNPNDPSKQAEN